MTQSAFLRDFREAAAGATQGCIVLERPDIVRDLVAKHGATDSTQRGHGDGGVRGDDAAGEPAPPGERFRKSTGPTGSPRSTGSSDSARTGKRCLTRLRTSRCASAGDAADGRRRRTFRRRWPSASASARSSNRTSTSAKPRAAARARRAARPRRRVVDRAGVDPMYRDYVGVLLNNEVWPEHLAGAVRSPAAAAAQVPARRGQVPGAVRRVRAAVQAVRACARFRTCRKKPSGSATRCSWPKARRWSWR